MFVGFYFTLIGISTSSNSLDGLKIIFSALEVKIDKKERLDLQITVISWVGPCPVLRNQTDGGGARIIK